MAKKKKTAPKTRPPVDLPAGTRERERKLVTFGGSMIRDVSGLPGLLEKFVTVSRRYSKFAFNKYAEAMSAAFGHINAETLVDDLGNEWPPGSLLHLGTDGQDSGKTVILVHKFLPLSNLYTAVSFAWIEEGLQWPAAVE